MAVLMCAHDAGRGYFRASHQPFDRVNNTISDYRFVKIEKELWSGEMLGTSGAGAEKSIGSQ
jgi:hypothetical protein